MTIAAQVMFLVLCGCVCVLTLAWAFLVFAQAVTLCDIRGFRLPWRRK